MTVGVKILAVMPGGMKGIEETGCIGEVLQDRGADLHWVFRLNEDPLPDTPEGFDGLFVFGGEIGAHEPQYRDYFDRLCPLIRAFHDQGKPVFGSCLGAQSIAQAFGGRTMPQGFFEFGFTPLHTEAAAKSDPLLHDAPDTIPLFEMHNDTMELPPSAVRLMRGDKVVNQAFRIGTKTYGFQCHFEATADIVAIWCSREQVTHSEAEATETLAKTRREFEQFGKDQHAFGRKVVNRWLDLFEPGS